MNVKVFTPKQILSGSGMSTVKQILLSIVAIEKVRSVSRRASRSNRFVDYVNDERYINIFTSIKISKESDL